MKGKNVARTDLQKMMTDTPSVFHATMYPTKKGRPPVQSQIEKAPVLTGHKNEYTDA